MGYHPTVLLIIADRLAQPEGEWTPLGQTNEIQFFPYGSGAPLTGFAYQESVPGA